MTRTSEAIPRRLPRHFTTSVRTDRRQHLVILFRQHKNVVLLGRHRPPGNLFGNDLPCDRLRPLQFPQRHHIEPLLTRRRQPRAQKTKSSAANRTRNRGQHSHRQQPKKQPAGLICLISVRVHLFHPWLSCPTPFDARRATILPTVAIARRSRQNDFCITESFQVRQVNLYSRNQR
jgi:hypothetical protein